MFLEEAEYRYIINLMNGKEKPYPLLEINIIVAIILCVIAVVYTLVLLKTLPKNKECNI